jgi:AcrR family transcriptional regulator
MEGIAARAGVGKPTIYRTWPNAQAVAMAAMMKAPERESEPRHLASRAPLARLKRQLREVVAVFNSKMGRNVAIMIAAASQETELSKSFRNHFILARREEGRQMLDDALAAGELRRSISMEVALDMIYGPIFYRLLMGHAPLEDAFTDAVLEHALQGLRSSP